MVFVQERKKGKSVYLYLGKSIRVGKKLFKLTKYLGGKIDFPKNKLQVEINKFALEINDNLRLAVIKNIKSRQQSLPYPITMEEVCKIEEMKIKYLEIKKIVDKKDWIDIKKRFVANFVFESNALEGNSLTLKNFSDIIFENRVSSSADMREVYDAKNSYAVFSNLFNSKKEISEEFIKNLHKSLMKNIDDRVGYKKLPNIILGSKTILTELEDVPKEMKNLLKWYKKNKDKFYPLDLAFKFHHKFEKIHPFADGNGRVGRMLLNYILIKESYFPIIIRKSHRNRYIKALEVADNNQFIPLMRFALEKTKETYRKFFEVYYKHI